LVALFSSTARVGNVTICVDLCYYQSILARRPIASLYGLTNEVLSYKSLGTFQQF